MSGANEKAIARISVEVAALFAEIFERDSVAADDDFFQLGGDSILAEDLVLAIEERFGSALSVSTLLEASSPRALAGIVLRDIRIETGDCVIPIRAEGRGPPLFCIHGANGNITYGQSLKTVFGSERPTYAIRAPGLLPNETPLTSVEASAAHYISEIRKVRPQGPYLLLAPCGPSVIAYEMAQQFVAAGERVPGLVMADPGVSGNDNWVRHTGLARMLVQSRAAGRAVEAAATAGTATGAERIGVVRAALYSATAAYVPTPYQGGAVLILYSAEWGARIMNPERGFPSLVPDLRSIEVSAAHITLENGFRGRPAAAIRDFLGDVAPLAAP